MTTLSIPLKDIHLGGEELATLPEGEAIARIQGAYTFLCPLEVTIDTTTARIVLPDPPPHLASDANRTFDRTNCTPRQETEAAERRMAELLGREG